MVRRLGALAAVSATLTGLILAVTSPAEAQDWPNRPITMVAPFAAGGSTDAIARIVADGLSTQLHQPVIVENIGGAGGMTGANRVAKAAPDGYQFGLGNVGTHAVSQSLSKNPPYHVTTDFAPVALFADLSLVLVTRKDLPANNLQEFIAYAKAHQDTLKYGSAGAGSGPHITCVMLNNAIGVNPTHIPYRGSAQAEQDLVASRFDYLCDFISTALPQINGKTVKPIATLTRERTPVLPDLATADEQGLKGFDSPGWYAFVAPAKTPAPVIARLNKALAAALETPAVAERLQQLGNAVPSPAQRSPEFLAQFIRSEIAKWAAPIKASGTVLN
jgi:tripartite-type tricarboxylate transporter receptor subunit TctC